MKATSYVSCIRINGFPILPPLVTKDKRKEILKYRKQAAEIEKRLKEKASRRDSILERVDSATDYLNKICEAINDTKELPKLTCDIQASQYINNEFGILSLSKCVQNEEVLDASSGDKFEVPQETERPFFHESKNYLTALENYDLHSKINFAYNNNLCDTHESKNSRDDTNEIDLTSNTSLQTEFLLSQNEDLDSKNENILVESNRTILESPKKRLIRSNSYTLETPSPVLVEHLKKKSSGLKKCWASLDSVNQNDANVTITNTTICDTSCTELKNLSDTESSKEKLEEFINNNVPTNTHNQNIINVNDLKSEDPQKVSMILHDVITQLPDEYSKQVFSLLERKLSESGFELKKSSSTYSNEFRDLYEFPEKFSTPYEDKTEKTIFYTVNKSDSIYDYESANSVEDKTEITLCERKKKRRLEEEEKAAEVLTAAAKGYLTRRLLRTNKVQGIIQIIKEAYLCAVQLHTESIDKINESDVELHRRLIQQVAAAYHSIYDVFFNTSISERMTIIALDRKKALDKLQRSTAGSTSSIRSTSSKILSPLLNS